jgi:nucleoside phosphorylase/CheY-like chemotaxis protein
MTSSKGNILLLENDPDFRSVLNEWLESEGYKVFAASNVDEAEELLLRKNLVIHLIITDLRVTNDNDPNDFSGLGFARVFATTIPKIILTAYTTSSVVVEALRPQLSDGSDQILPPAIDFLSKTEGIERLLKSVENAFRSFVVVDVPEVKVGGALTFQDAAFYIERKAERELIRYIQDMDYILIIEPRQQGKTSLINYAMRCPQLKDTKILYIDTTTLDYSSQEEWYKTLCVRLLDRLVEIYAKNELPSIPINNFEWRQFLSQLARTAQKHHNNLVIALDEIGARPIPNATDFFMTIRDIYNSRQGESEFFHLCFMLVGSFHPRDLITDDKVSPFNIAKRVRLDDFTQDQIYHLAKKPNWSDEKTNEIIERIYYWTSGQPYLTQKLCEQINLNTNKDTVDSIARLLQQRDDNHLPSIIKIISTDIEMKAYLKRILSGEKISFLPSANKQQSRMELIGILQSDNAGNCIIRNRIFEQALRALFEVSEEQTTDYRKDKVMVPHTTDSNHSDLSLVVLPNWASWMEDLLKNPSETKSRVDIGIVIALEEEFRELAPQIKTKPYYNPDIKQYYYLFERGSEDQKQLPYRCVVTFMGTMGPTDAGIVGDRLIAQFNPKTIVSIGIAGSMDKDVLVGNVIVADQTDEYLASSRAVETSDKQDWEFQFSGNPYKSDPTYIAHASNLRYAYVNQTRNWEKASKQKLLEWIGSIAVEKLISECLIGDVPGIHIGHVASGPIVGAAEQFVQWLREKHDRKLLALEMESAGVLNAAHKREVSSLIIRGISDYSDERKTKMDEIGRGVLRRYAINNALGLLWLLIDLRLI